MKETVEERFWKHVQKTDTCWLWTSSRDGGGYGQLRISSTKKTKVHRYSYQLHIAPPPAEIDVLHTCDTPSCVNPAHLFLGTAKDNAIDRENKGRGRDSRGEKQGATKLTEAKVYEIFQDFENGMSKQQIADKQGVSDVHVGRVLNKEKWAHLWK